MNDPYRPAPPVTFPPTNDEKNLQLLALFHYVLAGIIAFMACFFLIYVVMGIAVATHAFPTGHGKGGEPPASFGWLFAGIGTMGVLVGWTMAAMTAFTGRMLSRWRRYNVCLVVDGLLCMFVPFGTVLGVLTIVILSKPHIRALFDAAQVPPAMPRTEFGG